MKRSGLIVTGRLGRQSVRGRRGKEGVDKLMTKVLRILKVQLKSVMTIKCTYVCGVYHKTLKTVVSTGSPFVKGSPSCVPQC